MVLAIPFPDISPELFSVDIGNFSFALRWYALAYVAGILIGWRLATMAVRRDRLWPGGTKPFAPERVEDLITAVILGILAGGRLGFVLFYQPAYYLSNPLEIPMIWQGGMSFHGGMLGMALGAVWFARKQGTSVMTVLDLMALGTPPGLLLGRIANFINAELWGRPTELPWGVVFPGAAAQDCPGVTVPCARHPSQLYEAGLEGLVLGALILFLIFAREWTRRPGQITGVFLAGYGLARIFVENVRQADAQFITPDNPMGHVVQLAGTGLSMGQILSLPMVVLGVVFIARARRGA